MPPRSYYTAPRTSDYIAFARAYFPDHLDEAIEFATRTGLPFIGSSQHISSYLGISHSLIRQIIHNPKYHYRDFELLKLNGEIRKISTPKTYLKVTQWWILDNILKKIDISPCAHGFRSGYSYVTNAKMHEKSKHILNIDLKNFFDNIKTHQIKNAFSSLGYSESGSTALTALTTREDSAPTGAPTSPMIANLVFRESDIKLKAFSESNNLIYTRYADDLTFSGPNRITEDTLHAIEKIVNSVGFQLNKNKTKFMGPGDRQEVTGIVVNNGLNTPREWRNWARGYLYQMLKNPEEGISDLSRIRGVYGILLQFDPDHSKKLTRNARETLQYLKKMRRSM